MVEAVAEEQPGLGSSRCVYNEKERCRSHWLNDVRIYGCGEGIGGAGGGGGGGGGACIGGYALSGIRGLGRGGIFGAVD